MTRLGRLAVAARVFCVAAILGLSLAAGNPKAIEGTMLLAAIGGIAIAADLSGRASDSWVFVLEGALAALVVGASLPGGLVLLPYLVVPSLLAGLVRSTNTVWAVFAAEFAGIVAVLAIGQNIAFAGHQTTAVSPWLLTSLGAGMVGSFLHRLGLGPTPLSREASYESARRLLTQLRTVARRLSSGLDTVALSAQLLAVVHDRLDDTIGAVFVRTEGGVLAPTGYRGTDANQALRPEGDTIERCWAEMVPIHEIQQSGVAARRYRTVLPLRVGSRMIGVVVADAPAAPAERTLDAMMDEVDDQALRLDAALAFDEVRELATTEERQRLAREIHDGVAQEIASLGYVVDDLTASTTSDLQRRKLHALRGELTRVVSELRLSIYDLRSEINPSAGLGSAISDYIREVGTRSGMTVQLTLSEEPTRLRGEVETELLRIVQEAVTNARKHSGAGKLWVECTIRPPFARIEVRDDGAGLGVGRVDSFGLRIMKERAQRIGATLDIVDHAGANHGPGTSVTVTVGEAAAQQRPEEAMM